MSCQLVRRGWGLVSGPANKRKLALIGLITEQITNQPMTGGGGAAGDDGMASIYRLRLMNQISFWRRGTLGFSYTATM